MMKGLVGNMAWSIEGLWVLPKDKIVVGLDGYTWQITQPGHDGTVMSMTNGGIYPMVEVELPARVVRHD